MCTEVLLTDKTSKPFQIKDKLNITLVINLIVKYKIVHYSVQPRDKIFVKSYGFIYFGKNLSKYLDKKIRKNLTSKYSQKLLDHTKQFATDALKIPSKNSIKKTAEATGDFVGNKIANDIMKALNLHLGIIQIQLKVK